LPANDQARNLLSGVSNVVDVAGSAKVAVAASANLNLNLGIDLTDPLDPQPFVYDTTGMSLAARATGTNLNFTAAVGPLGVYIKNGSAVLDGDGNVATSGDSATFTVGLAHDADGRYYFRDGLSSFQSQ